MVPLIAQNIDAQEKEIALDFECVREMTRKTAETRKKFPYQTETRDA